MFYRGRLSSEFCRSLVVFKYTIVTGGIQDLLWNPRCFFGSLPIKNTEKNKNISAQSGPAEAGPTDDTDLDSPGVGTDMEWVGIGRAIFPFRVICVISG